MLPQQTNKRLNYHRNNHVGYHPYYSSSPLGVPTSNLHCVSSSSASSSVSSSAASSHSYHNHHQSIDSFRKEILLTQANLNQFNSSNELSTSQNNNTFQEDEHNLSLISTKTNPPTTPVSLTSQHNTPNIINGSFETNENSPVYNFIKPNNKIFAEPILNVTPVTSISSASSVANMKDKYSASCSSSCSSAVSTYSSALATYSRSSSMNSLNSFDIKSTHSSAPSDYSCVNNKQDTGFMTPSCYSDLPDSPGELFPSTSTYNRLINSSSLNNSANNQQRYLCHNKLANTTGINEISVLTVDSNPSKSNDITIVERTVLATNSVNTTSHLINNYGTSGCTTFIQNEDVELNEDDENVVAYDVEGSLCDARSTRSNVSSLSFPTEPTADLTFIRNLLTQKSSLAAANFITDQFSSQPQQIVQQPARLWSNYTFNKTDSFTPPVKLKSIENNDILIKTNKKLIYEDDFNNDDQIEREQDIQIEDEEDDCARSIASLPSDIVRDTNSTNINKSNFNALFNKLSNNLDQLKKTNKICESSPLINNKISFNNNNNHISEQMDNSFNNQDDNDEKILQDFIDEMLPIALAKNNANESNNESNNESMNEEDEKQLLKYQLIYQKNDLESHIPLSSNLPKIDEVDEDEIITPKIKEKLLKNNLSKSVVVQMTKTTLLRANKVLQNKSNLNSNKRIVNQLNENTSNEKRQILSNSSSLNNIQSKCFNSSASSLSSSIKPTATKKHALMPSNKLNTIKTTITTSSLKRSNLNLIDNKSNLNPK